MKISEKALKYETIDGERERERELDHARIVYLLDETPNAVAGCAGCFANFSGTLAGRD